MEHVGLTIQECVQTMQLKWQTVPDATAFSSPEQSSGRAIALPPAPAVALAAGRHSQNVKVFALKFLCNGQGADR